MLDDLLSFNETQRNFPRPERRNASWRGNHKNGPRNLGNIGPFVAHLRQVNANTADPCILTPFENGAFLLEIADFLLYVGRFAPLVNGFSKRHRPVTTYWVISRYVDKSQRRGGRSKTVYRKSHCGMIAGDLAGGEFRRLRYRCGFSSSIPQQARRLPHCNVAAREPRPLDGAGYCPICN